MRLDEPIHFIYASGLGCTLLLLAMAHKALPALPISITLAVIFYFVSRFVMEPVRDPFSCVVYSPGAVASKGAPRSTNTTTHDPCGPCVPLDHFSECSSCTAFWLG